MANRNFRNDQAYETVPDITMAKFIENVGSYFPDLDMAVSQEQAQTPGTSGTVLTFTNPRTAAMFAAYQIGRRSGEYRPGSFVLARLEGNALVFDTSEVFLDHQEATRAQRSKSRSARRPHLLFSTTEKTMEYAANVSNCDVSDFRVVTAQQVVPEYKDDRFTPAQMKFLEKHFGRMMDEKVRNALDAIQDTLSGMTSSLNDAEQAEAEQFDDGQQDLLEIKNAGLSE